MLGNQGILSKDGDAQGLRGYNIQAPISSRHATEEIQTDIVTIATRGYSAQHLVNTIQSNGEWEGDIVVISDTASILPARVIVVPTPSDSLWAVDLKTQLFMLSETSSRDDISTFTQRLLYLDADMAANSRVQEYLDKVVWDPSCSIYMVKERWYAKSQYNSGTMLLDRTHSQDMLSAWHTLIEEHHDAILSQKLYSKDQWALMELLNGDQYKICPLPSGGVSFAADFLTHWLWGDNKTTFTHWTSAKKEAGFNFKEV